MPRFEEKHCNHGMHCALLAHSLLYRTFVGRWDTGIVLGLVVYMDAAAELERNPVSKHQIQRGYGDEHLNLASNPNDLWIGDNCRNSLTSKRLTIRSTESCCGKCWPEPVFRRR